MKRGSIIVSCLIALAILAAWVPQAEALPSYFSSNCSACHQNDATSCAACHMHGTHSGIGRGDLNVRGTTNKTSYTPGEAMTVSVTGGNNPGWVRVILYNNTGAEVARSSGPCNNPSLPDHGCGSGDSFPGPIVLSTTAPAAAGTYTFKASWYGNQFDGGGAFFGPNWRPDPRNPGHGEEIVSTNSFTVTAAPPVCTDRDGDGFAVEGGACGPVDCNDADPTLNPGAAEVCTDGIDNNCNGLVDAADPAAVGCPPSCSDHDGDGYSVEGGVCGPADCNDSDPAINPGAVESCTDGIDNNCNGLVDGADPAAVGCPSGCTDQDRDHFSIEGGSCGAVDCDDSNPNVNPGAVEDCADGIDNNCDGFVDGADAACQLVENDYDIVRFHCTPMVVLNGKDHGHGKKKGPKAQLGVSIQNQGTTDPGTVLSLVGNQGGTSIPLTPAGGMKVKDSPGRGNKTVKFSYAPTTAGTIDWHAILADGDPDADEAVCTTAVVKKGDDDDDDDD